MNKKALATMAAGLLGASMAAQAVPVLQTVDFIADSSRTHFNGFEGIPTAFNLYTGGAGPYVEGGIKVQQIGGDPGNDIWVTYPGGTYEGVRSWYPNGGGPGYTEISLADGSAFVDFGFYAGSGGGTPPIYFDLLLNGSSVLTGSAAGPTGQFGYIGFSGGGFDTIRIRNGAGGNPGVYNGFTSLTLDALETAGTVSVPEPGTLALFSLGMLGLGLLRRRRSG